MVDQSNKITLVLFTLGKEEKVVCELVLTSRDNSNILSFESENFLFKINLKDIVDFDDFYDFLKKKEKKVSLYCELSSGKVYKGERKLVWKNENIAISIGGIRIEFDVTVQDLMEKAISSIKYRIG